MPIPKLIDWTGHGGMPSTLPATFHGATTSLFGFEAEPRAVDRLAAKLLGAAAGGRVRYSPAGNRAFVTYTDIRRIASRDVNSGWLPGRECALWLPLIENNGATTRLVFWTPYIFIDQATGLVAGREIWGWSKFGGHISLPDDEGDGAFDCTTTVFDGPGLKGERRSLLRIEAGTLPAPAKRAALSQKFVRRTVWDTLADVLGAALGVPFASGTTLLAGGGLFPTLPVVALKQFPDVADTSNACYQAIVNAPCRMTRYGASGTLDGDFVLRISTCRSHRIVGDLLGRDGDPGETVLPVTSAFWMEYDFEALAGSVVAP